MKKKFLAMVLGLSMVLSISGVAFAAETKDLENNQFVMTENEEEKNEGADIGSADEKNGELQNYLENYFSEFYDTMKADSTKEYSSTDFSSVRGYIVAKWMVNQRRYANKIWGGVTDITVDQIQIEDLSEAGGTMEAMVYVNYSYMYANGTEPYHAGVLYRVTLSKTDSGYQVMDLDNQDIDILEAKAAVLRETEFAEGDVNSIDVYAPENPGVEKEMDYAAVDAYFEQQEKYTDSLLGDITFAEPQEDADDVVADEISPLSTSVSFKARKARNWGYKLGDNAQNYIFKRTSLDCTNFVSQCVWSGYGGIGDYTIPVNPKADDATCAALKNRGKADYRMTDTWYGRNYDSPLGDPPTEFCGVEGFFNYVTSNTGDGPKATANNNGQVYTNLPVKFKQGDVLQFYSSSGRYTHSVIVVSDTAYAVSDYGKVMVAQHQPDYKNRPLSDLINARGGASCKMRLLRFNSTTFSN